MLFGFSQTMLRTRSTGGPSWSRRWTSAWRSGCWTFSGATTCGSAAAWGAIAFSTSSTATSARRRAGSTWAGCMRSRASSARRWSSSSSRATRNVQIKVTFLQISVSTPRTSSSSSPTVLIGFNGSRVQGAAQQGQGQRQPFDKKPYINLMQWRWCRSGTGRWACSFWASKQR